MMIRPSIPDDLDAVMRLWLETNLSAHAFIPAAYWQDNYAGVREMLPDASLFVYSDAGQVVGFVGLMGTYIAGIFINAQHQSQGIGKALLDHVKAHHAELSLQVYQKNPRAVQFYLREGFSVTGEKIDEATGETELILHWSRPV